MNGGPSKFTERMSERRKLAALGESSPTVDEDTRDDSRPFRYGVLVSSLFVSNEERAWLESERKRAITDLGLDVPPSRFDSRRVHRQFPRLRALRRDRDGAVLAALYCRSAAGSSRYVRRVRCPFVSPYGERLVRLRRDAPLGLDR